MASPSVYLRLSYAYHYSRLIMMGATRYFHQKTDWSIAFPKFGSSDEAPRIDQFLCEADGLIALVNTAEDEAFFTRSPSTVINVSARFAECKLPSVLPDNTAVGAMAARFFLERGYHEFAVLGRFRSTGFFQDRRRGFVEALRAAGIADHQIHDLGDRADRASFDFCHEIPTPYALFSISDTTARNDIDHLLASGLSVPQEVAVLGVDNDPLEQARSRIQISSVDPNFEMVGYRAAEMLHRMHEGASPPTKPLLIPPFAVVERASTDALGVRDEALRRVMAFIQDSFLRPIGVPDLVEVAHLSRRALEQRFKAELGHSPLEEIHRTRLRRAKELLARTEWPMERIAAQSGFADAKQMGQTFRKYEKVTPSAYRAQFHSA